MTVIRYHATLCIEQLHLISIYSTGFWVCAVLMLNTIMCFVYYFLNSVLFHHKGCDHYCDFCQFLLMWPTHLGFPWVFLALKLLFAYWIGHATFGFLCAMFRLSRIFYRVFPGFATDRPCGVWCRELTTWLLNVDPRFGNLVWNYSGFESLTWWRTFVSLILFTSLRIYIIRNVPPYDNTLFFIYLFHAPIITLFFAKYSFTLRLDKRSLGAFYWE